MSFSHQVLGNVSIKKHVDDCPPPNVWSVDHCDLTEKEGYIFVNLADNRESFTAYEGAPIWKAIYEENCHVSSDSECSDQTLLFQLMSGLHTSINTHISDGFDDSEGISQSNMTYF